MDSGEVGQEYPCAVVTGAAQRPSRCVSALAVPSAACRLPSTRRRAVQWTRHAVWRGPRAESRSPQGCSLCDRHRVVGWRLACCQGAILTVAPYVLVGGARAPPAQIFHEVDRVRSLIAIPVFDHGFLFVGLVSGRLSGRGRRVPRSGRGPSWIVGVSIVGSGWCGQGLDRGPGVQQLGYPGPVDS